MEEPRTRHESELESLQETAEDEKKNGLILFNISVLNKFWRKWPTRLQTGYVYLKKLI